MDTQEEWRPVPGYEEFYEVSSCGKVRSLPGPWRSGWRNLAASVNRHGYCAVRLSRSGGGKTYHVHALVAAAFWGPRPDGFCIHHRDGAKTNNAVWNLEYVPNGDHRGLHHPRPRKKILSWDEVCCVRALAATTRASQVELAEFFGVSHSFINGIISGRFCTGQYPDDEVDTSRRPPNEMQEALALMAGA